MQAVTIHTFGDAGGMAVVTLPEPSPGAGHLLIEVEAMGVGGVDAVIRRGTLGSGFSPGLVPGSEVAGRVIGVGEGVDPSWIGERVWAFTGVSGGYAERAVAALDDVTRLPAALSAIDAVTLGSAGPVAHFALAHAHFTPGETLLVRGASGSIGIMAVQIAAAQGARSIGVTTSSRDRGERLRMLGADRLLDRSGAELGEPATAESATQSTAQSAAPSPQYDVALQSPLYDVVLDVVAGAAMPAFFDALAPNGRLVSVGVVGGYPPADFGMALMRAFQRSLSFSTFSLNTVPISERNRIRAEQFDAAARGELRAVVHDVLPLHEASEAHRRMDAGEVFGRIVLTPED
ncbi:zinc-binding dehydrogenase [Subtercola endophyticus]|uniref:zinc-binding dehydrogenase n=1 Tax=Subtercola endophyticus TaxID=2895559 RepID=UPI001E361735|nr:zinc-binding dehydrogenase [Subtercola endophyticus]UFS59149.1 zinc-binding dehydrogenase [Subtercola endophyticus]